jgi:hypothetical protein
LKSPQKVDLNLFYFESSSNSVWKHLKLFDLNSKPLNQFKNLFLQPKIISPNVAQKPFPAQSFLHGPLQLFLFVFHHTGLINWPFGPALAHSSHPLPRSCAHTTIVFPASLCAAAGRHPTLKVA